MRPGRALGSVASPPHRVRRDGMAVGKDQAFFSAPQNTGTTPCWGGDSQVR